MRKPLPIPTREAFRKALEARAESIRIRSELLDPTHPLNLELDEAWRRAIRGAKPKSKIPDDHDGLIRMVNRVLDREDQSLITQPFHERFGEAFGEATAEIEACEMLLRNMAQTLAPMAGFRRLEFSQIWLHSYSTQTNPRAYAEAKAELDADIARANSIEAKVRFDAESDRYCVDVLVADPIDVELLRYRPSLTLRDWLKGCWKRGVNPRVYEPFLPHGLETRLGIDYQGNDLPQPGLR